MPFRPDHQRPQQWSVRGCDRQRLQQRPVRGCECGWGTVWGLRVCAAAPDGGHSHVPRPLPSCPFTSLNDQTFLRTYRLDKNAVLLILDLFYDEINYQVEMPAVEGMLATLRYFATGSIQAAMAQLGASSALVMEVLVSHSRALTDILTPHYLNFPDRLAMTQVTQEFQRMSYNHLPFVLGCVATTKVNIASTNRLEVGFGSISYGLTYMKVLLVCGPRSEVNYLLVQDKDDESDWHLFRESYLYASIIREYPYGDLLVDYTFPYTRGIQPPLFHAYTNDDQIFNDMHFATRAVADDAVDFIFQRFPGLQGLESLYPPDTNHYSAAACILLHNLSIRHNFSMPPHINENLAFVPQILPPPNMIISRPEE